ncbi:MAG: T9SS type A sorting domain-containing protein [Saprospiraceae bacterium]
MKINHLHLCFILFLLLHFNFTHAQTFVNTNVIGGANDGSSWANAYPDLAVALGNANSGDEIWVAQGTYYPTTTSTRTISFQPPNNLFIYAGFSGNGTEVIRTQRDWQSNTTIISGDIGTLNDPTDNTYQVIRLSNTTIALTMDGFSIQDGYANNIQQDGGALFISAYASAISRTPTFNNCTFQNNYSELSGGAVYVQASAGGIATPAFNNCIFQNNTAGSSGGAVYNDGSSSGTVTATFIGCTFKGNIAGNVGSGSGGAVYNNGSQTGNTNPIFKQCNFENNAAITNHGGAMYNQGNLGNGNCSPNIINCRFYNNSGYAAGAIYNNGTDNGNSSPTIINSTFVANNATNASGNGGALYANGTNGTSSPVVTNCIFWGNTTANTNGSEVIRSVFGAPILSYCLVDKPDCMALQSGVIPNVSCGAGMIYNQDPLFNNLATGDLTLLSSSSPAADNGLNSANSESFDLIGVDRISNTTIDLGAYEFEILGGLPIELISFQANYQQDKVKLSWVTANEINNEYFTIQHSVDGVNFQNVEEINGAGNSTAIQSYFSFHKEPRSGFNYYRLMQTDFDGTSSLSHIEAVKILDGKINAFPNPVINEINVSFAGFEKGKVDYAIYNIYGKEIFRQQVNIEDEFHVINLNEVGSFLPGTYFIKIFNSPSGTYVHKFQKVVD